MALKIQSDFDVKALQGAVKIAFERAKKTTANFFISVGKEFNASVLANKGYQNITHSLISSTGFIVVVDGNIVHEEFLDGSNATGRAKGQRVAKENIENTGVMLVCVAGENYASLVESKGKDVITGSSQEITGILKRVLSK